MAASPVPILAIIGIYAVIYALVVGAEANTYGLDNAPTIGAPSDGVFSSIGNVFTTIGGVFSMILGAITFNVPGAPVFVRIPVAIIIIGSLSWSVVTLVRGN